MYCKFCGKKIENSDVCEECKSKENTTEKKVEQATVTDTTTEVMSEKSKIAGGLFGIFFGAFGVHNFYLGYTGKAIAQLLITVLSCFMLSFVSVIWGLIEGILILSGDIKTDAEGKTLRS